MGDRLLEELVSAMSAERQEAIARRTAELLDMWRSFEPVPLAPFDTSAGALSWLALARDAVAEIRRVDVVLQDDPTSPEKITAPSADANTLLEDLPSEQAPAILVDGKAEGETPAPAAADEVNIIALEGGIDIAAAISGGAVQDEAMLAVIFPTLPPDVVAAEADAKSEVLPEGPIALEDAPAFPILSPFEGDDASAALARAVSEGLALRTLGKPRPRNSNRAKPMKVHPAALTAYVGPPTSGTRLSSP
ncbi:MULTISPECIES: hypothetical protein [unclassified Chelatococcus]|uniref:hypothetical protein n=1 Tax=unclassified Chelatococcus TaxID=2638111 RepID=UPI001BCBB190|nr:MULTISPECIES: hypothetical protein [unclassified Chelatococcus]MBS7699277.1 hypothetical protein [Chelatococcus sp. YT9]MBX3557591.1 hypothetical protein [Chelatococcus sp.]